MRIIATICISILLFTATAAHAEEAPPANTQTDWITLAAAEDDSEAEASSAAIEEDVEAEYLEPVIVTATSIETPVSKLGSSATVVTKEEFRQQGTNEVIELLRNVPGVIINQTGPRGGTARVHVRGGESDFTLIMIDGVRVTDDGGLYNLAHLTADNIDRIEVIRGPQSALYGADAMSGVINIITKRGEGPPSLTASTEIGMYDTYRESISLSGSEESVHYALSASYIETGNVHRIKNDRYNNTWLSGSLGFDLGENTDLSLIATYQDAITGLPGPTKALPEDSDDEAEERQITFALNFDQYIWDDWEHVFQFDYLKTDYHNLDPSMSNIIDYITDYESFIDRITVNYQHNIYLWEDYVFTAGVEWLQEDVDIYSMSDFGWGPSVTEIDETRINKAAFGQVTAEFLDRLNVVAGFRYDDNSSFGSKVSPRFSANYHLVETNTRIKGSYGEGIKNPSFFDLFSSFGNPDLEAEENTSWDVGVEQDLTIMDSDVTVAVTYFDQEFDELIQFVGFAIENFGESVARGIETEVRVALPCNLMLSGMYTYLLDAEYESDPLDGKDLLRRPKHSAALTLNYNRDKWNANLNITYTGDRNDLDPVTYAADAEADDFTKVDVAVSYDLNKHIQLIGMVENLLDDDISQSVGFESTGISFLGGVRGVF